MRSDLLGLTIIEEPRRPVSEITANLVASVAKEREWEFTSFRKACQQVVQYVPQLF